MPSMAPTDDERRKPPRFFGVAIAAIFGLLLLYVLSVGPSVVVVNHGRLSEDVYYAVYAPLFWLCDESDAASEPIYWYIKKWDDFFST